MNITTFAPSVYRGKEIYIRYFANHFEYLTVIKGKIFTAHLTIRPDFKRRMLSFLGKKGLPYTDEQLKAAIKQVTMLAETTIDSILDA